MTFVCLTDFATGREVWVALDHICMVYYDIDMDCTCVTTDSVCSTWVKETVQEVMDAITEDDD